MKTTKILIISTAAIGSLKLTLSFSILSQWNPDRRSYRGFSRQVSTTIQNAYVYSGEDTGAYGFSSAFQDDDTVTVGKSDHASPAFLDFISKESAALARLAVAYSPKDRTLNIKNINQVSILNLGTCHIDIAALVCDDQSCVSLAVPVSFPKSCSDITSRMEFESCIIDNLGKLSVIASQVVVDEDDECALHAPKFDEVAEELASELRSDRDVKYPEWWEFPQLNLALSKNCDAVRSLLNEEDFQYDLQQLVSRTLESALTVAVECAMKSEGKLEKCVLEHKLHPPNCDFSSTAVSSASSSELTNENNSKTIAAAVVKQAAIAALGPAGMIIKACLSSSHATIGNHDIIDIPFKFPRMATDLDGLHDEVLAIVDDHLN